MDFGWLFRDDALRQEFLDRFGEISAAASVTQGLEGLEGGLTVDRAAKAVNRMTEGSWAGEDPGLPRRPGRARRQHAGRQLRLGGDRPEHRAGARDALRRAGTPAELRRQRPRGRPDRP